MKPVLQKNYRFANKCDEKVSNILWEYLREAIHDSNITVKNENKDEMFLSIPGEDKADIELYSLAGLSDTGYVKINLWYYEFNHFREDRFTSHSVKTNGGVFRM